MGERLKGSLCASREREAWSVGAWSVGAWGVQRWFHAPTLGRSTLHSLRARGGKSVRAWSVGAWSVGSTLRRCFEARRRWISSAVEYPVSHGGRSADFPVRSKLLPHNRPANRVQVGVRTTLRAGKSALRDLRPPSLTGYAIEPFVAFDIPLIADAGSGRCGAASRRTSGRQRTGLYEQPTQEPLAARNSAE